MLPGLYQYSPPCGQVVLGTSSLSVRQCLLDRLQGSIIHKCQCQSLCVSRSAVHCACQWTGSHNDRLVGLLVCSSSRCLMLYGILCWLLPCLTLAARVFYRAVVTSDCRFVFDLHRDYLLTTMMFLIFLREYLNCFYFRFLFLILPEIQCIYRSIKRIPKIVDFAQRCLLIFQLE